MKSVWVTKKKYVSHRHVDAAGLLFCWISYVFNKMNKLWFHISSLGSIQVNMSFINGTMYFISKTCHPHCHLGVMLPTLCSHEFHRLTLLCLIRIWQQSQHVPLRQCNAPACCIVYIHGIHGHCSAPQLVGALPKHPRNTLAMPPTQL